MADIRSSQDATASRAISEITARNRNPNYMARIVYQEGETEESQDQGASGVITLYLPENFQLNFSSSFDQPFAQGLVNMPGLSQATKFFGASLTSQSMSVQVWQGTSCPEFNLTFQLIAESDPVSEILDPIKRLSKLALPGVGPAKLLSPPGPRIDPAVAGAAAGAIAAAGVAGLAGAVAGAATLDFSSVVGSTKSAASQVSSSLDSLLTNPKNNVTLYIGRFLRFPSVVIQSVSQTYDTVFNAQGLPLKASVDVTFSTWYVPVKSDVNLIFQGV